MRGTDLGMQSRARISYSPKDTPKNTGWAEHGRWKSIPASHNSSNRTRKQRKLPESEMSHHYRKPAVRHSYCSVPQKPSSDMLCFLFSCSTKDLKSLSQPRHWKSATTCRCQPCHGCQLLRDPCTSYQVGTKPNPCQ